MASLKRTNPATPAQTQVDRRRRQVAARPAGAATDEKTQTADAPRRGLQLSGDRAPTDAADAPYNSSNLQATVQHNADKEKEKAVEANLWTRVSTPCQTWRRGAGCCCHVEATASSSASKLRRKGEGKCHGTIEARSSAAQRGI